MKIKNKAHLMLILATLMISNTTVLTMDQAATHTSSTNDINMQVERIMSQLGELLDLPGDNKKLKRKREKKEYIRKSDTKRTKKIFTCTHGCDYKSNNKKHMERHILIHTGEKPFQCIYDQCTYASTQRANLDVHMRTHTGEKPFTCTYQGCDYSSALKAGLKYHIQSTHTGQKTFKCDFDGCAYAFCRKNDLKKHIRTHANKTSLTQQVPPTFYNQIYNLTDTDKENSGPFLTPNDPFLSNAS